MFPRGRARGSLVPPRWTRRLASKPLPAIDSRNRVLLSTESELRARQRSERHEARRKALLCGGSVTGLAGAGLLLYTHAALLTAQHVSLSLITAGGGMLLLAVKDHEAVSSLFSRKTDDSNEADEKSSFTFKLMNQKDMFEKELVALEVACRSSDNKWPAEVQDKLDALNAKDVTQLEQEISERRNAMIAHMNGNSGFASAKEALSSLAPRVFVVDYRDPDPSQSSTSKRHAETRAEQFGREVSLLIACSTKYDTVLVNLQSPGGAVSEFGLAASHLLRLKKAGVRTVVTVDKVAASGGFMMACCADEIIAAPFSFIGSVGVIAELPNISKVLSRHGVDWNTFTAGKFKRTVTVFSEVTEEGKAKFQSEIESIHNAFKQHVQQHRGDALDIEQVSTGEAWLAIQCKEYGLVDRLATSLDVMQEYSDKGYDVIKVEKRKQKKDNILRNFFDRSILLGEDFVDRMSQRLWVNVLDPASGAAIPAAVGQECGRSQQQEAEGVARMSPHTIASRAQFRG